MGGMVWQSWTGHCLAVSDRLYNIMGGVVMSGKAHSLSFFPLSLSITHSLYLSCVVGCTMPRFEQSASFTHTHTHSLSLTLSLSLSLSFSLSLSLLRCLMVWVCCAEVRAERILSLSLSISLALFDGLGVLCRGSSRAHPAHTHILSLSLSLSLSLYLSCVV